MRGDFGDAHTTGDQAAVLPTDTQKNTAFAFAKEHGVTSPEDYALALGARAVAIGRPYAYALALAGEDGVRELLRNTIAELDITLGLAGVRGVAELDADVLAAREAAAVPS